MFFDENWHDASFYIKEQMQKYKFERLLKSTILDPRKSAFFRLGRKAPPNFLFCFSALIQL